MLIELFEIVEASEIGIEEFSCMSEHAAALMQ
jgi:hypothetical protein